MEAKMRNKAFFVLVVVSTLLTGCLTSRVSEGTGSLCPSWAGYNAKCDVKIYKDFSPIGNVDLSVYEKVRITAVGGEILIDNGNNITVRDDYGEVIDYVSQRLPAGSYIIERTDKSTPASFTLTNPHEEENYGSINIIAEFVKPVQ
ncbi:hypothetical protein A3J20_01855 [Candidatus Gottesmanbacteria bacterium RIFCSPLOWO2_02_FULL_42_29]|uniref:Lipoprotein n=1 Tax=Candidatus Gottesmanbacteria bacterium RIFCSPLOWO2_01_FULL_42_22 TaxID=1798391 RepID=A0A1F6BDI5_9BACT|nr:MAG: hypothetical protein UV46_C0034G0008 [Candidatus Gottesmanbacteria bacterium GW2011_GWC2_42_8]OGG12181.1 MAG: hypothetical protein A2781_04650 [Candidatus Gottesmanbacteria bacterium RIFCSPHIGHO2_01_FULL_42_27]OGG19925.1 MAG: hypothetical protein A3E72_02820 [Candidatus Gottesmanbacteria bacterium RIFCSPHIGHO2_12_FULL_43_26]OGG33371.1 MAG: hypothetical protein A3G68_03280 [Candidatus Gottesmanbacteria bacterium RIFCSPLOWO2_12_FULL_42_10]OGG35006.1 MAG: hypothetical protein A2968_00015 [